MKVGWMWFDNDPKRSIEEKIQQAVGRYYLKFKHYPNRCYVNEQLIDGDSFTVGRVKVVAAPNILPHHFWLGVSDEETKMEYELTDGMKIALIAVGYGVRKYATGSHGPGFYSIEDPDDRVDGRSLQALFERGLIDWYTTGGAPMRSGVELTEEGHKVFEELNEHK